MARLALIDQAARVRATRSGAVLGPRHPLASRESVRLADEPIWMPSLAAGTEWAIYYDELSRALGIGIDTSGPNFGSEEMLTAIARSSTLATFMGAHTRPASLSSFDLRLVALHEPTPAYPHSLIWHRDNTHQALALLRAHAEANACLASTDETWTPA